MFSPGKLRKQLIVDLSMAFGLGITGGYAFWFGYHIPSVRKRDAYYAKLEAEGTGKFPRDPHLLWCTRSSGSRDG